MSETFEVRDCSGGESVIKTVTKNWERYTPPCPSTDYSTYQYDMRRKAEILKYKKNQINDSGGTRKSRFSRLVNTKRFSNRVSSNCDTIKVKPASSSNVPGNQVLFLDPSVPLTRFGAPLRTYRTT